MIRRSEKVIVPVLIVVLVILINTVLFSIFPVLQNLFSSTLDTGKSLFRPPQTVIEYREPEKKKQLPVEQKIRQIVNPGSKGMADPLAFKFTPDLSVEGTGGVAMERQDLQAVVFEEGEIDEAVVPVYRPPVPIPERARELNVKGILEAEMVIGTDGRVISVEITKSPHSSFTSAAKKMMSTWRFKPARNKGIPVRVRIMQEIEFKMD